MDVCPREEWIFTCFYLRLNIPRGFYLNIHIFTQCQPIQINNLQFLGYVNKIKCAMILSAQK